MIVDLIEKFGLEAQMDVTQEECSELIKAISKYRRVNGKGYPTSVTKEDCLDNLIEELAHVKGCVEAVIYLLKPIDYLVEEKIDKEIEEADKRVMNKLFMQSLEKCKQVELNVE